MLFETEEMELPGGLEIVSTIVSIRPGTNHRLRIPIIKKSKMISHYRKIQLHEGYIKSHT